MTPTHEHNTPPGGFHPHRRYADRIPFAEGAIKKATEARRKALLASVVVGLCALLFGGSFFVFIQAEHAACEQRTELATTLIQIFKRSRDETLPMLHKDGVLTRAQLKRSQKQNTIAIRELTPAPC